MARRTVRHNLRYGIWALCALLLVLLFASCQSGGKEPTHVVVALFDTSGSTAAAGTRQLYTESGRVLLERMTGGDTLIADAITYNSLGTASYPVWVDLPQFNALRDNRLTYVQQRDKLLAETKAGLQRLIATDDGQPHTDLFNAVASAARVLNASGNRGRVRVLVIFSDMVNQTVDYDFTAEKLTPARIQEIIERERANKNLPDLHGVHIWVVGANHSTPGQELPADRLQQIQHFWLAYFTACGAQIDDTQYVPRLTDFALPGK